MKSKKKIDAKKKKQCQFGLMSHAYDSGHKTRSPYYRKSQSKLKTNKILKNKIEKKI